MPRYETDDGKTRWTRVVYVVELQPEACMAARAPCRGDCLNKPVYVGETALDPQERLAKHLAGGRRSSKWVRRFGVRLIPSLTEGLPEFDTEPESKAAEKAIGDRLSKDGYCVFGAH